MAGSGRSGPRSPAERGDGGAVIEGSSALPSTVTVVALRSTFMAKVHPVVSRRRAASFVARARRAAARSLAASSCVVVVLSGHAAIAAPTVTRLTPPSALFSRGEAQPPIVARFLLGQRFDLEATVSPEADQTIESVRFQVDGKPVAGDVVLVAANATDVAAGTVIARRRAFATERTGVHTLAVVATQSDGATTTARGNFEIVRLAPMAPGPRARNLILMIGDGMGIAHRTAARLMLHGASQGKANGLLAMDRFPFTALIMTASLNSIITDSSPGASCYATGNKSNNNQHGVFPDDTIAGPDDGSASFDNPRVESIAEYFARRRGKALGLVTTADVFDSTPAAFASHTQARGAGTGIVDQYFDDRAKTGLTVLLGGGRKWFLPQGTPGSARGNATDYVLPPDLVSGWGVAPGKLDPSRDLIADFTAAGFAYAPTWSALRSLPAGATKVLGLFALSNMNVALDKIAGRRGTSTVVDDYGFPDQPMLDEMTDVALDVLRKNKNGFVLMVEGASIDKQAHAMDSERWILDTIEFDRAVAVARSFAERHRDTLVIVTADHETGGVNIIGGSKVTNAELVTRATSGGGADELRKGVVGTYEAAGFPHYDIAADGYPATTDVDHRLLIGYAANADRNEDWLTNPRPLRDPQQPFDGRPPLDGYPKSATDRDAAGKFAVTGQEADAAAAHTASDVPLSAFGAGAARFSGVMDNTDVFFRVMSAAGER
jgi:alkaline phosphatase